MNTIERLLEIQRLANAYDETPADRCRAIFYIASHAIADELEKSGSQTEILVELCRWFVRQCQGDSGTGDSHWSQFPEYRTAKHLVELIDAAKSVEGTGFAPPKHETLPPRQSAAPR